GRGLGHGRADPQGARPRVPGREAAVPADPVLARPARRALRRRPRAGGDRQRARREEPRFRPAVPRPRGRDSGRTAYRHREAALTIPAVIAFALGIWSAAYAFALLLHMPFAVTFVILGALGLSVWITAAGRNPPAASQPAPSR